MAITLLLLMNFDHEDYLLVILNSIILLNFIMSVFYH